MMTYSLQVFTHGINLRTLIDKEDLIYNLKRNNEPKDDNKRTGRLSGSLVKRLRHLHLVDDIHQNNSFKHYRFLE